MRVCDTDGDGQISFEEFKRGLKTAIKECKFAQCCYEF